jgi:hypothetical protein
VDFDRAVAFEQHVRQEDFDVFRLVLDRIDRNICKTAAQPRGNAIRPALFASECGSRRARTETFQYGKLVQSNRYGCGPAALRTVKLRAADAGYVVDVHYDRAGFLSEANAIRRGRALPCWRILALAYGFAVVAGVLEQE